jgi:hypothetical protein
MAKFVVETSHTEAECLKALDEAVKMGTLDKVVFGCKAGEHKSWSYVEAGNKQKAIESVIPTSLRSKATAHEVGKFTPEEVKAAHSHK